MPTSLLYDLAADLLTEGVAALECGSRPVPDVRFVTFGVPAFDCELLSVHLTAAGWGADQGTPATRCAARPTVTFALTLVRCWPVDVQVTADDYDAAAAAVYADTWALMTNLAADRAVIFDAIDDCAAVRLGSVARFDPAGGLVAVQFPVTVNPSDLDPPCGAS